jgi:DnaD/phage-associated family protein
MPCLRAKSGLGGGVEMARSRNIKPGFFLNDELAECEPLARLLFAGLWCIADREGRLEDRPKRIKAEILPYDDCDIDQLLNQLAQHGFILRYEIDGCQYIQIVNFSKHQNPHYKESESIIPSPPGWIDSNYVAFGVPEELRQETFDRDGRKCVICGAKEDLSIDHIIPRSKGGTNDPENLQTLCRSCNSSKKNREAAAILKDKITISSANDRPMIGQSSVNDSPTFPADSLKLIPDCRTRRTDTISTGGDNSALKKIYDAFNANIHPITPFEAESLAGWLDDGIQPDAIIWAIRQAVLQGKRTAKYIDAIIRNLHAEGITTAAAAEARERERANEKMQGPGRAREPTKLSPEEKERIAELNRQLAEKFDINKALEEEIPSWAE